MPPGDLRYPLAPRVSASVSRGPGEAGVCHRALRRMELRG